MSEVLLVVTLLALLKWVVEEGLHAGIASGLGEESFSKSVEKRLSAFSHFVRGGHALLYIAFLALVHSVTMNSKLHALEDLLYTPQALQDMSLFVMVDLLYVVYLCIHQSTYSRKWWRTLSRSLAPIMMFPTLFYIRLKLFYLLPGASFLGVTLGLMAIVALVTLVAPHILQALGVDRELLRELAVLLSLLLFFVVIVAGVLHPDSAVRGCDAVIQWQEVALLIGFIFGMGTLGYLLSLRIIPTIRTKFKKTA